MAHNHTSHQGPNISHLHARHSWAKIRSENENPLFALWRRDENQSSSFFSCEMKQTRSNVNFFLHLAWCCTYITLNILVRVEKNVTSSVFLNMLHAVWCKTAQSPGPDILPPEQIFLSVFSCLLKDVVMSEVLKYFALSCVIQMLGVGGSTHGLVEELKPARWREKH